MGSHSPQKLASEVFVQLVVQRRELPVFGIILAAEDKAGFVDVFVLGDVQHVLDAPAHQPPQQHQRLVEELGDHDEI